MSDERRMPDEMEEHWRLATATSDPLTALSATRHLREDLSEWERILAEEASNAGATWQEIGSSLGTTRQAAWERLNRQRDEIRLRAEKARIRMQPLRDRLQEMNELRNAQKEVFAPYRELRKDVKRWRKGEG